MSPPTPGDRNSPCSTRTAKLVHVALLPSDEHVFMCRPDSPQTGTPAGIVLFLTACVPTTMSMHRRDAPKRSAQLHKGWHRRSKPHLWGFRRGLFEEIIEDFHGSFRALHDGVNGWCRSFLFQKLVCTQVSLSRVLARHGARVTQRQRRDTSTTRRSLPCAWQTDQE